MLKPVDALDAAIHSLIWREAERKPGGLIARLPADQREALKRLTSDEALSMRYEGARRRGRFNA